MSLPVHPAAELFPMGMEQELKLLAQNIKDNGLLDPIITHEGAILDGRRREKACLLAKIQPVYEEWDGSCESPIAYVLAKNLERRHLSIPERAIVAVKAKQMLAEEAKKRQEASRAKKGEKVGGKKENVEAQGAGTDACTLKGQARDQAGKLAGVSGRTVDNAEKVLKKGAPELQEAMKTGKVPVARAASLADMTFEEQVAAIKEAESRPRRTGVDEDKIDDRLKRSADKYARYALDKGWKDEKIHAYLDERLEKVRQARKERRAR